MSFSGSWDTVNLGITAATAALALYTQLRYGTPRRGPSRLTRRGKIGVVMPLLGRLLPTGQGAEMLEEARDHFLCAAGNGEPTRRLRLSLILVILRVLPGAWYREIRRRLVRQT